MDLPFNGIDFLCFIALLFLFLSVLFTNEIRQLHKVYIAFHFAMMMWPFGMFSLSMVSNIAYQWYYVNLSFLGISFLGYSWLLFSLMLTKGLNRVKRSGYAVLGVPALLSAILVTTNPMHEQFMSVHSGNWVHERLYGPAFWYLVAISFLYLLFGAAIMVRHYLKTRDFGMRRQIALFLVGQVIMLLLAAMDTINTNFRLLSWDDAEGLTSLGILISDICFVIAIRKNNAFRIISIALREVVDSMDTGIVVMDDRNVVLDHNIVAGRLIPVVGVSQSFPIEWVIEGALEPTFGRAFLHSYFNEPGKLLQTEILVPDGEQTHIQVRITPIYSEFGVFVGRIVTLQDVTEWRRLVVELHDRNEDLMHRNSRLTKVQEELSHANRKLKELATIDPLTGCFNRRYLFQMLEYQISVEQRYRVPFSLLLFDVDHFKQINDRYGHQAGDEVLSQISDLIRTRLRESDIFARYGGEEFTIYLPHTGKQDAERLAEQLRSMVESHVIYTGQGEVRITISIGLISVEGNFPKRDNPKQFLSELIRAADLALYQAKHQGRNCVVAT